MVRKVIPSRVRRHNVLKIKSKNRFLLRKKASIVGSTEKKRRSKVELNDKELALLRKTITPLIKPKKVHSKVKAGMCYKNLRIFYLLNFNMIIRIIHVYVFLIKRINHVKLIFFIFSLFQYNLNHHLILNHNHKLS